MNQRRASLTLAYIGMGITAAMIGPSLPALADRFDASPSSLSLATSLLFSGLLVGVAVGVAVGERVDLSRLLATGGLVQAVALALVPLSAASVHFILLAGVAGVGFGISELTATVVVARQRNSASNLTHLTAVFAGAAIATPVLVSGSLVTVGTISGAYLIAGAVHTAAAILAVVASRREPQEAPAAPRPRTTTFGTPVAMVVLLISYVGAEATIGTWSGELSRELLGLSSALAAAASTGFWVCLMIGRVVAARLLRRAAADRLLMITLLAATATGAIATALDGTASIVVLALTCIAMGPVYGLTLALAADAAVHKAARRTGLLIAVGALGGAGVPALVAPFAEGGSMPILALSTAFLGVAWLAAALSRSETELLLPSSDPTGSDDGGKVPASP